MSRVHRRVPEEQPPKSVGAPRQPTEVNELLAKNQALDRQVKERLRAKSEMIRSRELPPSTGYFAVRLRQRLEKALQHQGYDPAKTSIAHPNRRNTLIEDVDLAFNAAGMAKAVDVSPVAAAMELADAIGEDSSIAKAETVGPFVNMQLDYREMAPAVLAEVNEFGELYGSFRDGDPETIVIDYSSPNVAKNMTVAHLRSTIIGHTLAKIHEANGNIAFGVNHIGDWGTQFGNIIYQYEQELAQRGEEFLDEVAADPTATLMRIYRDFNETKTPEAVDTARNIFRRLEEGDPELVELWTKFREWSLRDFGPSYDRLGITFDAIQGESFYEDKMPAVVEEGVAAGVLQVGEDGAVLFPSQPLTNPTTGTVNEKIMLGQDGEPSNELIIKPNGGTVYLTRDLAAIKYRAEELGADRVLYVIGKEQEAHCLKLFAIAHQMGIIALGNAEHISFGHLNTGGRKMSSRAGKIVLLNEMLDEAIATATSMMQQRRAEASGVRPEDITLTDEERETARKVGIGAVIFSDLRQDRQKDIEFNPDMAATLEAGGATYIQYTHSRLSSVLDKVEASPGTGELPDALTSEEQQLISQIAEFPLVVREAAAMNAPHKIAAYLTKLCQTVNVFYRESPIMKAEHPNEQAFRLALVAAIKQVITNASNLLHIELPERM